ncbi:hypothetical protein BH11PLA2_BH11PLA2_11150 [soil metagenome]
MARSRNAIVFRRLELTSLEDRLTPAGVPLLDSWLKSSPGEYARVLDERQLASGPTTTWNSPAATGTNGTNATATLGDTQKVSYSTNFVYVQTPDFSSSVMGPWYNGGTNPFPNYPSNQNGTSSHIFKLPRTPVAATTHTATALGAIGVGVNGVSYFNMSDGMSYSTATLTVSGKGSGYWNRDALVGEGATLDHAKAHQPQSGEYHYHTEPTALRAQLRDNIAFHGTRSVTFPSDPNVIVTAANGDTDQYAEYTNERHHSPILGYALDGYPIYGPYGYSDGTSQGSAIVPVTSSYRLRNITVRQSLPGFAAKAKFGDAVALNANGEYALTAANYGPAVNATYPLGTFIEDYEYVAGLGMLDMYNTRFTKTPEYPNGTVAYFTTLDPVDGHEAFPYSVGRQYYGVTNGSVVTSITETVTPYFDIASPQSGGSVRGVIYFDTNGNGMRDASELGYSSVNVYLDANGNNSYDTGETTASTGLDGGYELPVATTGAAKVRLITPAGYVQTTANPQDVAVSGGNAIFGVTVGLRVLPPTVSTSQVNDGSSQRSTVTKIAVTLSEAVTFPNGIASAFSVARTSGGTAGSIGFTATQSGNVITIAFTNSGSIALEANGSVPNGRYTVTAFAANISGSGGFLDGDANGTGGDNATVSFFRLFADSNGDATVNGADLDNFGNAFSSSNSDYDYNNDGTVNGADLVLFGNAFSSFV